ncbi:MULTISPECIES: hypothetical protein [Stenotrophomonas]|uniref:hypothetical protein n=1 Tax=Stenotrophomonas TaxID=40323 RepID=UPI000D541655|nr:MULTISPECIES: hypothetical protein [Stenotrophomonas]AWH25539.1 hypothetical protein C1932_10785 [Stenotrophomonas sp. YAU14D1_LEIMI4_1]AWH33380.1 hypothetical protein C1930_11180 [Stenotrophomonas sp. SAU14A_NAIMI4_8]
MKAHALLFVVATFALGAANAQAQEARFISSEPSPFKRSVFVAPNETRFSGSATVSGTLQVAWEPESEGFGGGYRVVLKPDAASQRRLPHDAGRGPVSEIWIRNTDTIISALLSPAQRKAGLKQQHYFSGPVRLVLNSYRTGVDCDMRGYNALFVAVADERPALALAPRPDEVPSC